MTPLSAAALCVLATDWEQFKGLVVGSNKLWSIFTMENNGADRDLQDRLILKSKTQNNMYKYTTFREKREKHIYIYIYMRIYMLIYIYEQMRIYICVCVCVCVYIYLCIYLLIFLHVATGRECGKGLVKSKISQCLPFYMIVSFGGYPIKTLLKSMGWQSRIELSTHVCTLYIHDQYFKNGEVV